MLTCALLCAAMCFAQPTTAPTSAPTTRPRYELTVPPGFKMLNVNGRTALCAPADEAWVTSVLQDTGPATRPTTMPADMLTKVESARATVAKDMMDDLAISDKSLIDQMFDNDLIAPLTKMRDLKPPLFYLATTSQQLKDAVKGGWTNPRLYYNRVADDVSYSTAIELSIDRPIDDQLIVFVIDPARSEAERKTALSNVVMQNEAEVQRALSNESQAMVQGAFLRFIADKVIAPLEIKPGQEWFALGISGVLSVKYVAAVNGMQAEELVKFLTRDNPNNPIRSQTLDLLNPTPADQLRPEAIPAYLDAMRRKSVRVCADWFYKTGSESIPKSLSLIRQAKPADGPAMVKLIKEATGEDLTSALKPN